MTHPLFDALVALRDLSGQHWDLTYDSQRHTFGICVPGPPYTIFVETDPSEPAIMSFAVHVNEPVILDGVRKKFALTVLPLMQYHDCKMTIRAEKGPVLRTSRPFRLGEDDTSVLFTYVESLTRLMIRCCSIIEQLNETGSASEDYTGPHPIH